jgi:two-component system sensor histidine kinase ChvG
MINRLEGDSEKVIRRSLSKETKELLLPLAGRNNQVRIRLFQPNGLLYADTKSLSQLSPKVEVLRLPKLTDNKQFEKINDFIKSFFSIFQLKKNYPLYEDYLNTTANNYNEVLEALKGFNAHEIRQDKNGKLILSVAAPIGNERRVRGAIMLSMDGIIIQDNIADLQYSFLNIFGFVIFLSRLAAAADNVRNKKGMEVKSLIKRKDEIGELALSLDEMTKDLFDRMDAIASFAADVSHEIKNPLTSLRSAVETLSIIKDERKKTKLMKIILEDINRLDRLITDISDASRLDADLSRDEMKLINLSKLINGFINIKKETTKEITFINNVEDSLVIFGNQSRLLQVLDNLIGNSISFSPKKGKITIEGYSSNGKVKISIADQGKGISEKKKETIFERFYSDRPSDEKFGKHSGLGLSIVKQILEKHNAKIVADNIYNENQGIAGAKFTIEF